MKTDDYPCTEMLKILHQVVRICSFVVVLSPTLLCREHSPAITTRSDSSSCVVVQDVNAAWEDCKSITTGLTQGSSAFWTSAAIHCVAAAGVEAALIGGGVDDRVQGAFVRSRSAADSSLYTIPNSFGTTGVALAVDAGLYLGGWVFNSSGVRTAARSAVESLILAGIGTTLLKVVIGRARPDVGNGSSSFSMFKMDEGHYSLPSGHTTVAFATASSLARSADNVFVSIGLYSLASATAAARMYYNKHWFSDVVLGAAIGIGSASIIDRLHESSSRSNSVSSEIRSNDSVPVEAREIEQDSGWSVTLNPLTNGLCFSYIF